VPVREVQVKCGLVTKITGPRTGSITGALQEEQEKKQEGWWRFEVTRFPFDLQKLHGLF
jgi:hypothetical protein